MPLVLADRVRETTTTTGTGTISLAGPVSGFQGFSTAIGNANTTYYTIVDAATGAWEVGLGTYTSSGSTLSRDTVFSSSNSGSLVPFGAGTKDVFVTQPAERAVYVLGAGTGLAAGAAAFTANGVVYANSTSGLTTGSALTFDGAKLNNSSGSSAGIIQSTDTSGSGNFVRLLADATFGSLINFTTGSSLRFATSADNFGSFSEQMRLTSTGLGIGTSSPARPLDVRGSLGMQVNEDNAGTKIISIRSNFAGAGPAINVTTNDPLLFLTNNTEQMRLTSTGLGIGTSSPSLKLDVNGSAKFAGSYVSFNDNGYIRTDAANILRFQPGSGGYQFRNASNSDNLAVLDSSGNLGIGTSSPITKLHTSAFAAISTTIDRVGDFGPSFQLVRNGVAGNAAFGLANNNQLGIYLDNIEQGRWTSTGLGIGTSSPGASLHVAGAIGASPTGSGFLAGIQGNYGVAHLNGTDGGLIDFSVSGTDTRGRIIYTNSTNAMGFGTTDGVTKMTLDSSGNLGLGVTPSAWNTSGWKALEVGFAGNAFTSNAGNSSGIASNAVLTSTGWKYGVNGAANFLAVGNAGGSYAFFTAASGTANDPITFTQAMTLDASGNLSVGGTNANAKLNVITGLSGTYGSAGIWLSDNATTSIMINNTSNGVSSMWTSGVLAFGSGGNNFTERARIDSSGNLVGAGTTSIIYWEGVYNNTTASAANMFVASNGSFARSTSALKYKQDIRDLGAVNVDLLRPVRYKSKCENDDQTKDHFGLIADEAADAGFEELVTRGSSGEVEGFQYERLTVVLLKEIQSLRQRVAQLEGA